MRPDRCLASIRAAHAGLPAGKKGRRWVAWFLFGVSLQAPAALAAPDLAFYHDADLVSVGDPITVTLRTNALLVPFPPIEFVYTYEIPDAAQYVPNSFSINGLPVPDSDSRLHVSSTAVTLTLASTPIGLTFMEFSLRATGSIGDAVHHEAQLVADFPTTTVRTHPTRIEDETAILLAPAAEADARLSEKDPSWNFGVSMTLGAANNLGESVNSALRFDLTNLADLLPVGWEVQAAYLELYPTSVQGAGNLEVRPILQNWNEGIRDGAPCLAGATWTTSNCVDPWVGGGKLDGNIDEVFVDAATEYAELEVGSFIRDVLGDKRLDHGIALQMGIGAASLTLGSREASNDSTLAPRLVIIAAAAGNGEEPAASDVRAEIVPTQVIAGIGSTRFTYWMQPRIEFGQTGINRVTVSIPAEYTLQSVDALRIGGNAYDLSTGTPLAPFAYENWGSSSRIDLRFYPEITWLDGDPSIEIVLHAKPPNLPTAARAFPSTFDNDRRGQPAMNAREGDANQSSGAGDTDKWDVVAIATPLVRIDVAPADTSVAEGFDVSYEAVAVFADSSHIDISLDAVWDVVPDVLGSFASPGVFTAESVGAGTVTATWNAVTSNAATLQVDPAQLLSLFVTPANQAVAIGASAIYQATGIYSSGDSLDVTASATWSVDDSTVAAFSDPGILLAAAPGTTALQATLQSLTAPALLTVSPEALLSIQVSPTDTSVALGFEVPMQATGSYSNGTSTDITSIVTWNSTPPGVVDIGADGVATTLDEGSTAITASLADVDSDPATFTVTPPSVVVLDGTPDDGTVTVQGFHAMRSWATYSNGDVVDKTTLVTWTSLDPAIADFVVPGTVEALSSGVARFTHSLAAILGDTLRVTVTPATLDSVVVEPRELVLPPATQYGLTATGYWSNGASQDVTLQATWSSDNNSSATVDADGEVSTNAEGVVRITVLFGGVADQCSLVVSASAFDSLVIQPSATVTPVGLTASHVAQAYRMGAPLDVTHSVAWSTGNASIATVDSSGTVTGTAIGSTTLHASLGALLANPIPVDVTAPVTTQVTIVPATTTLRLGTAKQLTATATQSDGQAQDVTAGATWQSQSPSIVYMQAAGTAQGLSLGEAEVTAAWEGVTSSAARLTVLPSVQLEALPVGDIPAMPGTRDALLLSLRLRNHDIVAHELTALRVTVEGPADTLRLWLDNGDGIFDPGVDGLVDTGQAGNGRWTATNVGATLPVAGWRTLFVSADVSLTEASHGDRVDASILGDADLFWDIPTAVVAPAGYPLDSFGDVSVQDLVLAQFDFQPQPADTVFPGAAQVSLLQFTLPDDGGVDDVLNRLTVQQIGNATANTDIGALRLQTRAATGSVLPASAKEAPPAADFGPWQPVATLVHTGANTWAATGLTLTTPANTAKQVRLVADIATTAREGRTLQLQLPTAAMLFASGRQGPVDSGWSNPHVTVVEAQHELVITQTVVVPPDNPVSRTPDDHVVLGLELTAWAADNDALTQLTLQHISTGPQGPASDVDAQVTEAQLWLDNDANGQISAGDTGVATSIPGALIPGQIEFGTTTPLNLALPAAQPVRLLVSLRPHVQLVRDAEFLRVALASAGDVQTQGDIDVILPASVQTLAPPQVDGQDLVGYDVRPIDSTVLLARTTDALVLDFTLPANGIDDDVLQDLRIENRGNATTSDVSRVGLWRDDGNGTFDAGDALVTNLSAAGSRAWQATSLGLPLLRSDPRRFYVTVDVASNPVSGRTFQASVPLQGVQVDSGNDGPIDAVLVGGDPHVISVRNLVTWLAGGASSQTAPPDASNRVVLILDAFNGYNGTRTLSSLDVAMRGTAAEGEFQLWRLHSDENGNALLDDGDLPLAFATIANGRVLFTNFTWNIASRLQQRLLVSYSLNVATARDGSRIDAVIESENAFGYQQSTQSIGSFELDSPGVHTIDGMILDQVGNLPVPQRSLGGGENDVLALDLLLPSNGWQEDTLRALQVRLSPTPPAAAYGVDVIDVELWRESDASPQLGQFDPQQDLYVQRAVPSGQNLLFTNLDVLIPPGGERFYVTVDMAANPTDSTRVQLVMPANGIVMQSGNDGPLDGSLNDTAVHTASSSDLLASVDVHPLLVSVGQQVEVDVTIRNQGSVQLDSVYVSSITVDPPGSAALVSGPTPAWLSLAPESDAALQYVFSLLTPGDVRFTIVARESSGPRQSDPAQSSAVHVQQPPSGLSLLPFSSLPTSVNRGQNSVTPLIWQLAHPDTDPSAADISIDHVQLHVQDAAGAPQLASTVFSNLEIRTGGLVHAAWDSIPADSILNVPLTVPVILAAGEQRDLPLTVAIDANASAAGFQVHLQGSSAVAAQDANSGQPVSLVADLPWSTQTASILTPATTIEVVTTPTLPPGINQGQQGVPGGSLTFVLPGTPGESEARITDLSLQFTANGQPLLAQDLFSRVRVREGSTTLLEQQDMTSTGESLPLPLAIPKVVVAGDSVRLDLSFDMLASVAAETLEVVLVDESALEVRDSNSGAPVLVTLANSMDFPWQQGPARIHSPAQLLDVDAVSAAPTTTFPGAAGMPVLDLTLVNQDPAGAADMSLQSLAFEVLDDVGNPLVPTSVATTARWFAGDSLVAQTSVAAGLQMILAPSTPFLLAPGDSLQWRLEVDLLPTLVEPWVRFHLPSNALRVRDANDPLHSVTVLGMPASTALVQVVAEAAAVGLGALDDPPTNVVPGSPGVALLPVRLQHPGADNEADIQAQRLVVHLRDVGSQPLSVDQVATAATALWDTLLFDAGITGDSLVFDLTALPPLLAGTAVDLQLHFDLAASMGITDFRVALQNNALTATSGSAQALPVQGVGELGLPYESPTVHVSAGNLEQSFASYPNPFIPAAGPCNITFFLPGPARVTCDVFTLSGQRVTRLLNGASLASGLHDDLTWDGRNERGDLVRNGTYLLRIEAHGPGGGEFFRKLAVIR